MNGDDKTFEAQRTLRLAHMLRRGAEGRGGRRQKGRGVSGDAIRSRDDKTHEAQRAVRLAHLLRRGAERGRGEGGRKGEA